MNCVLPYHIRQDIRLKNRMWKICVHMAKYDHMRKHIQKIFKEHWDEQWNSVVESFGIYDKFFWLVAQKISP